MRTTLWPVMTVLLLALAGCSSSGGSGRNEVRISPAEIAVRSGESVQLHAYAYTADGDLIVPPHVVTPEYTKQWSVTNSNAGSISRTGDFTAKQPGSYPGLVAVTYFNQTVYADVVVIE